MQPDISQQVHIKSVSLITGSTRVLTPFLLVVFLYTGALYLISYFHVVLQGDGSGWSGSVGGCSHSTPSSRLPLHLELCYCQSRSWEGDRGITILYFKYCTI